MNLNLEMEGDEDQRIQYVNRNTISIPSGGAAYFNLNIVNPGLTNQSYILNPVSPVGQNIVTYQAPVTLQSYIALQESGGNIVNNLPVGVPVPVGLPVPAGLLQNHNLVNTSIIIGNEECNSPVILKPNANEISDHGDIKISYLQKPLLEDFNTSASTVDTHHLRLNDTPIMNTDSGLKKPCPLEMSIKAANIDLEFEKCESEMTVSIPNGVVENKTLLQPTVVRLNLCQDEPGVGPREFQNTSIPNDSEMRKQRTEMTWDSNSATKKPIVSEFPESLICEVEEANDNFAVDEDDDVDDDDDDDEDYEDEEDEDEDVSSDKKDSDSGSSVESILKSGKESDINKNNKMMTSEKRLKSKTKRGEKESGEEEVSSGKRQRRPQRSRRPVDLTDYAFQWSDSDEDILDLKRIKNEFNYKCYYEPKSMKSAALVPVKLEPDPKKFVKVRNCCSKKECYKKITLKDQKAAHRNFYDLESRLKQDTYLINCIEHVQTNRTVLVGEDTKDNSPVVEEKIFDEKEDIMDHEKMEDNTDVLKSDDIDFLKPEDNIQLEIENESNGNQLLSDEIQKAINESLKDCLAHQQKEEESKEAEELMLKEEEERVQAEAEALALAQAQAQAQTLMETQTETQTEQTEEAMKKKSGEKSKDNEWNYYIVIDRCRKKVCLQFLVKLFRITKNRIKILQKKIISGSPITEDAYAPKTNEKFAKLWEAAKSHLDTMPFEECKECRVDPPHKFFVTDVSRQFLFESFKEFYLSQFGKELEIKYATYRRFLLRETKVSFTPKKRGVCAECEQLEEQRKREKKKQEKKLAVQNRIKKLDRSIQSRKKGRKKWETSTDSEEYSDNEPLSKRKKIKLTISLKGGNKGKGANKNRKKNVRKNAEKKVAKKNIRDDRSKPTSGKGRDVWSLMLLHLETMPYKVSRSCVSRKKHRFFDSSMTTQALYDDYRKYFLKETNSELGLGFTMYEKYFEKNCGYAIVDFNVDNPICPSCALEPPKPESNSKTNRRNQKNYPTKVTKKVVNIIEAMATDCRS